MDAEVTEAGVAKLCANVAAAQLSASSEGSMTTSDSVAHEGIDH